jgi:hypothetical protein
MAHDVLATERMMTDRNERTVGTINHVGNFVQDKPFFFNSMK